MQSDESRRVEKSLDAILAKQEELSEGYVKLREDMIRQHATILAEISKAASLAATAAKEASDTHQVVFGGVDPNSGLAVRVPRLEKAEDSRNRWVAAGVLAALAAAAKVAADWLMR